MFQMKIKIHIQVGSLWKILQLKEAITGDSILTPCWLMNMHAASYFSTQKLDKWYMYNH